MDWLNLHISVLDSPQVLRCDPIRRATWLFLLRYCIGQENGGIIADCRSWGDTTWQQLVRVKLREVNAECPLWTWDGDSLRVTFYPAEKETEVRLNRENGKRGGRPKKNRLDNHPVPEPETVRFDSAETERNGRGMEGKGITPAAAAAVVGAQPEPGDLFGPPVAQPAAALSAQTWMDWKLKVGRDRVFIHSEGNAETHWAELFHRSGWDEFSKAWEYCAARTAKPGGKVFLSNMLEVLK